MKYWGIYAPNKSTGGGRVRGGGYRGVGKGRREQNNEWPETLYCLQQQKSVILYMTYVL